MILAMGQGGVFFYILPAPTFLELSKVGAVEEVPKTKNLKGQEREEV